MGINVNVYKIDTEKVRAIFDHYSMSKVFYKDFSLDLVPEIIDRYHEERRLNEQENGIRFKEEKANHLELTRSFINFKNEPKEENFKIRVYLSATKEKEHILAKFFSGVSIEALEGKSIPSTVLFIGYKDLWFVYSIGRGYIYFENFIDTVFPINLARKIMDPRVSNTKERDITGAVYARIQQFRTTQLVESQSVGTVWSLIDGFIHEHYKTSDINKNPQIERYNEFQHIFSPKRYNVGVVVGSSIEIRSSVEEEGFLKALVWLYELYNDSDLEEERGQQFEQLDLIKEVDTRKSPKTTIDDFEKELAEKIINSTKLGEKIDFDFSHKDFFEYQRADSYKFKKREYQKNISSIFSTPPSIDDIIQSLKDYGIYTESPKELLSILKTVSFEGSFNDPGTTPLSGALLDYIHGEISYNNSTYFRIDGKWYILKAEYGEQLKNDFKNLLQEEFFDKTFNKGFLPVLSDCTKNSDGKYLEGEYNESYFSFSDFIVADRALLNNNIELADLIYFEPNSNNVYLYHNKMGFDSSTRDVCSQILQSMTWLSKALKSDNQKSMLKDYYNKIVEKHYGNVSTRTIMKQSEFVNKIIRGAKNKNICFVLGYIKENPVGASTRSNIARFEAIKLCHFDKRKFDFGLKIQYICKK